MNIKNKKDLKKVKKQGKRSLYPKKPKFRFGSASCGIGAGIEAAKQAMDEARTPEKIGRSSPVGCIGACYAEPLAELYIPRKGRILFNNIKPEDGKEIMKAANNGRISEDKVFCKVTEDNNLINNETKKFNDLPPSGKIQSPFDNNYLNKTLEKIPSINKLDYFENQKKIVLRNSGHINPESIEEYISRGGYKGLYKSLEMNPDNIIEEISKSKLRGRGGAGFPTGKKWKLAKEAEGETKYVISNGDEGDPGAYMDRVIMESDPHSMIEGMIIGAYTIRAEKGYIFVRNEYPQAVKRMEIAIEQAKEYGILGKNIMGSDFDFNLEISKGGGAFVCGEETALMSSIEGKLPNPRPRPPYPTESGLWGKPTIINNVKSWANIPAIICRGGEFLSNIGTKRSGETKVFSLVGDVKRRGLIEVKLGTLLKEIVIDIGGADPNEAKAVQTGGPSGGFIPTKFLEIPLDFETLTELGSIMGSGGLVVMDNDTCMVDMAEYFLKFTMEEGCGQCTPCREGLERMHNILVEITEGKANTKDLNLLRELASYIEDASLCGLGKTAPRPVLTTLDHFDEEYREHVEKEVCQAGVCDLTGEKKDE
ncbi:hypothetical protein AKJ50_00640 [candidate division MSBL1 archaeon SCGC-AAA382A13]|uniref:NADH-ubiquinone oxidoreductase 51kDa subunit iron-sulphur binding domain-containing protein n=1 Tax=candidate division MSBL1 archaeon SCGC-AAA382A13 TaxID=1698279 RepID=A0A133VGI2_9EURY|nr:hypothetical protein AKJ50_00640 [candidate division MSBL1 archaeon SCGC-AAA382A13]